MERKKFRQSGCSDRAPREAHFKTAEADGFGVGSGGRWCWCWRRCGAFSYLGRSQSQASNASPPFLPTQGARPSLSSGCQSSAPISRGKKAIPQVFPQTFIKHQMRGRNCARPTKSRRHQSQPLTSSRARRTG